MQYLLLYSSMFDALKISKMAKRLTVKHIQKLNGNCTELSQPTFFFFFFDKVSKAGFDSFIEYPYKALDIEVCTHGTLAKGNRGC